MKFSFILLWMIFFINANALSYTHREEIIENFDDGEVTLLSFPDEDEDSEMWTLDSANTFNDSPYSLKLFGNTWKVEEIEPVIVDSGDVWQIAAFVQSVGEIQGFALMDSSNVLFYSFSGTETLDIDVWVTVYQGAFSEYQWNLFQLPVADDWLARFDYLPTITSIVFVNDKDSGIPRTIYFDEISVISEDLPVPPQVEISYEMGRIYRNRNGNRNVDVQFFSQVTDPDSEEHNYFWFFGDDSTSTEQNPFHTFLVEDNHPYTVLLQVSDSTNCWGEASCQIEVDEGESTFPVTLNFVGDIMLARGYEQGGGIIPTQGVEAIFEPTLPYLGQAADISVANLECPLTTYWEHHPTKTIYFKGSPENAAGLQFAGIDIVTIANNHVYDYLYPGLLETQNTLDEYGILYSGAGIDSYEAYLPLFYNTKGVNFAFLASSDRTGQYNNYQPYLNAGFNKPGFAYMTPYYVSQQINSVRDVADLVIVETHSGSEYSVAPGSDYDKSLELYQYKELNPEDEEYDPFIDVPHMWDREIRHFMIDAGADLVVCHHPHIIQGLEVYDGKLIAHSLGNFVFDLSYAETMPSMILNAKVNESGFYEFEITPVFIDDYIPERATGEFGLHILDYLARRSKELNTYLSVDRENITAKVVLDTLSMEILSQNYSAIFPLQTEGDYKISQPFYLQRNGNISAVNTIEPVADWEYRLGREIIWFGNCEDEGCTFWNLNSNDEWYDENVYYAGFRSVCQRRFQNSGSEIITNFTNRIKRYSAGEYSLHGFIKTLNGNSVTVEVRYYSQRTTGSPLGIENIGVELSGNTEWEFFSADLNVPDNCNFFDIVLKSDCPLSGQAYSWFDNIGLIEWTDWREFEGNDQIENPNDFYFMQVKTNSNGNIPAFCVNYTETNYNYIPPVKNDDFHLTEKTQAILYPNFPNPFKSSTSISFDINANCPKKTEINIYNIKGQKVKKLINAQVTTDKHSLIWNGTDDNNKKVTSGIYFYELKIDERSEAVRKCLLIR